MGGGGGEDNMISDTFSSEFFLDGMIDLT